MKNKRLLPKQYVILSILGENMKLARLRRRLSLNQVAERTGISKPTIVSIEKGSSSVSLGAYFQLLSVYGLEKDIEKLAIDDVLGKKLQDAELITKKRAPKR